ncbi:MAG: hypothetical protein HKP41_03425 [Desulfobacterales bacterium]|nr:hypothetical protein [Desulfobacterales bacterium]
MKSYKTITEADIDSDFEYNFDLNPFTQLLDGIHWLTVTPVGLVRSKTKAFADHIQAMRDKQSYKRTFKGPVCMLK